MRNFLNVIVFMFVFIRHFCNAYKLTYFCGTQRFPLYSLIGSFVYTKMNRSQLGSFVYTKMNRSQCGECYADRKVFFFFQKRKVFYVILRTKQFCGPLNSWLKTCRHRTGYPVAPQLQRILVGSNSYFTTTFIFLRTSI